MHNGYSHTYCINICIEHLRKNLLNYDIFLSLKIVLASTIDGQTITTLPLSNIENRYQAIKNGKQWFYPTCTSALVVDLTVMITNRRKNNIQLLTPMR